MKPKKGFLSALHYLSTNSYVNKDLIQIHKTCIQAPDFTNFDKTPTDIVVLNHISLIMNTYFLDENLKL